MRPEQSTSSSNQDPTDGKAAAIIAPSSSLRVARAVEMLRAFGSVGVLRFDLTCTTIDGKKAVYRSAQTLDTLISKLSAILTTAEHRQWNVIVRPKAPAGIILVQLDDLAKVSQVTDVSFLVLQTSPGSFQAWVAVRDGSESLIRRFRAALNADKTASGATRVAGSQNIKPKYAGDFPIVELFASAPCAICTSRELEERGLLAPEELESPPRHAPPRRQPRRRVWPSYQRALAEAPEARNHPGKKDRSHADFEFCLISLDRNWRVDEVAARLLQESAKAQEEGPKYAQCTAERAAAIVDARREKQ